jgi:ketosteroid isomerase-like protein
MMKHCHKCEREYDDGVSTCTKDGSALSPGAAKPWERMSRLKTKESAHGSFRAIMNRYLHYAILICAFTVLSVIAISYSFVRDGVHDLVYSKRTASTQPSPSDEIMTTLNGWTAATNARDLQTHMSYYADSLPVYYTYSNISRDGVRATRAPAFSKYSSLNVQLANIQIRVDAAGSFASVVFDKTWDFSNGKRHSTGSTQQMLSLSRSSGRWLITGEKDLLVRYANW